MCVCVCVCVLTEAIQFMMMVHYQPTVILMWCIVSLQQREHIDNVQQNIYI